MEDWADRPKSESPIQPNSNSGCRLTDDLVEFPPLSPEDLLRLGEDLLHVYPIWCEHGKYARNNECVSSVSAVISRGTNPPTGLSTDEATELAETFRKVLLPRAAKSTLSV